MGVCVGVWGGGCVCVCGGGGGGVCGGVCVCVFKLTIYSKKLFFYSLVLGGGEKAKRSGKNTIRIKDQDSKPRSLKSRQNLTQSRFKDLLEEDSEAESRPDPNHILAFIKTNHQLPVSSVTMLLLSIICI